MLTFTLTVECLDDDTFDAADPQVRRAAQALADALPGALVRVHDSEASNTRTYG